jgi:hypothetical protein
LTIVDLITKRRVGDALRFVRSAFVDVPPTDTNMRRAFCLLITRPGAVHIDRPR